MASTTLPPATDLTGASRTQSQVKTALTNLVAWCNERQSQGTDIASATITDIGAASGDYVRVTGTTTITGLGTIQSGVKRIVEFTGALTLTHNATSLILPTGANITTAAGDVFEFVSKGAGNWKCTNISTASSTTQIQQISASVGSNALTISASALTLDFRSTALGSGTVTTVSGTPANLVISSGSTLGTVNAVQSRIVVLVINNAGTLELAAVNIAGGNSLDETGLISTTAEGGAGGADSASVIYSTTARSNVAYRVIGYIESTQATAGTWATAPSTIQGQGGQAIAAMGSLGYGQTWQNVVASRSSGTTYYNTTGKPIVVSVTASSPGAPVIGIELHVYVNGLVISTQVTNSSYTYPSLSFIVPAGSSYGATITNVAFAYWQELR